MSPRRYEPITPLCRECALPLRDGDLGWICNECVIALDLEDVTERVSTVTLAEWEDAGES